MLVLMILMSWLICRGLQFFFDGLNQFNFFKPAGFFDTQTFRLFTQFNNRQIFQWFLFQYVPPWVLDAVVVDLRMNFFDFVFWFCCADMMLASQNNLKVCLMQILKFTTNIHSCQKNPTVPAIYSCSPSIIEIIMAFSTRRRSISQLTKWGFMMVPLKL